MDERKDDDDLLSIEEVRTMLKVSRSTFHRMRRDKLFNVPAVANMGKILRWQRSSVTAWVRSEKTAT